MAVIKAVATRQTARLSSGIKYITNPEKTDQLGLVSGKDCNAKTALAEMETTKELYDKTDGRQYKHFIQSFDPKDTIDPEKAHELGREFAEKSFPGHEVLVATHIDKDHIHNHFIVNSVNFENGVKIQSSKDDLQNMKDLNDRICEREGLNVIEKKSPGKELSMAEYQVAMKGESWKFKLMGEIDKSMENSQGKEEFIKDMEDKGYKVKWTDERKEITYTTPEGKKSRGSKLHDVKYSKEEMENGFKRTKENQHQPESVHDSERRSAGGTSPGGSSTGGTSPGTSRTRNEMLRDLATSRQRQRELDPSGSNQPDRTNPQENDRGRNSEAGNDNQAPSQRDGKGTNEREAKQDIQRNEKGNQGVKGKGDSENQGTRNNIENGQRRSTSNSRDLPDFYESATATNQGGAKVKGPNVAGKGENVRIESPNNSGDNSPNIGSVPSGNALGGLGKALEQGMKELGKQQQKHDREEEKKREREEKRKEKDRGFER